MALKITVDKPEFNLREKLTRLDTARVPYEKMPSGSVIQTQFSYYRVGGTNNEFETTSNSFQQSPFLVKISPKFADSTIKFEAAINIKQNDGNSYVQVGLWKDIGGGGYNYYSGGTTGHGFITYRYNVGATAWDHVNFTAFDRPQTIKEVTYRLYLKSNNNSQVVRIGENSADEYLSAMEIRQ